MNLKTPAIVAFVYGASVIASGMIRYFGSPGGDAGLWFGGGYGQYCDSCWNLFFCPKGPVWLDSDLVQHCDCRWLVRFRSTDRKRSCQRWISYVGNPWPHCRIRRILLAKVFPVIKVARGKLEKHGQLTCSIVDLGCPNEL